MKMEVLAKSYWCGTGAHEKLYRRLFKLLVPKSGNADTAQGELLRAMSKIYYDYYNNGCCNMSRRSEPLRDHQETLWRWRSLIGDGVREVVKCRADSQTLEDVVDRVILLVDSMIPKRSGGRKKKTPQ